MTNQIVQFKDITDNWMEKLNQLSEKFEITIDTNLLINKDGIKTDYKRAFGFHLVGLGDSEDEENISILRVFDEFIKLAQQKDYYIYHLSINQSKELSGHETFLFTKEEIE